MANKYKGVDFCKPVPVIPTVYSEELSYGEQVGKLQYAVNECIEAVNNTLEEVENANALSAEAVAAVDRFGNDIQTTIDEANNTVDELKSEVSETLEEANNTVDELKSEVSETLEEANNAIQTLAEYSPRIIQALVEYDQDSMIPKEWTYKYTFDCGDKSLTPITIFAVSFNYPGTQSVQAYNSPKEHFISTTAVVNDSSVYDKKTILPTIKENFSNIPTLSQLDYTVENVNATLVWTGDGTATIEITVTYTDDAVMESMIANTAYYIGLTIILPKTIS